MKYIFIIFLLCSFSLKSKSSEGKILYLYIDHLDRGIKKYYYDCGNYPNEKNSLNELLTSSLSCWKGPYYPANYMIDPIGKNGFQYIYLGNKEQPFKIISSGLDQKFNTFDDLSNIDSQFKRKNMQNYFIENKSNFFNKKNLYPYLFSFFLVFFSYFLYRITKKIVLLNR